MGDKGKQLKYASEARQSILAGVKAAFQEFLADKPEPLVELPSTQCMVIKL